MLRMHINKTKKVEEISNDQETVTLEEETNPYPQKTGIIAKEKRQETKSDESEDRTEFIQRILSETIENCGHSELDPTENDPNIEINYQYGECGLMFESGKKSLALIYIL